MSEQEQQAQRHAIDNFHTYGWVLQEYVSNAITREYITSGYYIGDALEELGLMDNIDNIRIVHEVIA